MIHLETIVAKKGPSGAHTFTAHLRGDGGISIAVPLTVAELQSYSLFQSKVLVTTGQMITITSCEGRLGPEADDRWHSRVTVSLENSAASVAAPPTNVN